MTHRSTPTVRQDGRDAGGGGIAVVGMACRYPDAATPAALWENVLAGRRAFRRIPDERLRGADYVSPERAAPDRTYSAHAAVLTDWTFPRERFRIAGSTLHATDLAHWLALEVAADALADAGYPDAAGAPRDTTAVVIGNTLAGDRTRAHTLRLRWPYVRRVVDAALAEDGWTPGRRGAWLAALEGRYKAPFPAADEDTLAGGLPNTIAGRVCNQWDLHGGGYAVDGACASSLLAVINACATLVAGDADLVLAGGVDLSLDPFELVGFAKVGALADDEMRVFDARSRGFWPGEGCGIVALMREDDARAERRRVHAVVRGWGMSSDGAGGITRPTAAGQQLALARAYHRARVRAHTVGLFEGHGTGTAVGDAAELRALSAVRAEAMPRDGARAAVGSVKANVGHTKAAAGVAGLIKAAVAVRERLVPPTTGCDAPHAELRRDDAVLEVRRDAAPWPDAVPARAGVSAMGFGGINTHVVLEGPGPPRSRVVTARERRLAASPQDVELIALASNDAADLAREADALAGWCDDASYAELGDLAAALAARLDDRGGRDAPRARACVLAGTPGAAAARLRTAAALLRAGRASHVGDGVYVGVGAARARLGYLCSGQGAPVPDGFGFLGRRFPGAAEVVPGRWAPPGDGAGPVDTAAAQPNIVRASLAALGVLARCGAHAGVAVGHSLGELVALHWAGALDAAAAWRVAEARGRAMSACVGPAGAMAGLAAGADEVRRLIEAADATPAATPTSPPVIAAYNTHWQVVVAGEAAAVDALASRARAAGVRATRLAVSHAFHSPLVAPAAAALDVALGGERVRGPARRVVSTVTGAELPEGADVRALLRAQLTAPVRFAQAFAAAAPHVDLWVEVGPGDVLCGLARALGAAPALPVCAETASARPLCAVLGAAFALGAAVDVAALYEHRFTRPADPARRPLFIANPCERAPLDAAPAPAPSAQRPPPELHDAAATDVAASTDDALMVVRRLTAERAELPIADVRPDDRLLADLHLSSITVGEILAAAARALDVAPSAIPAEYAGATVAEAAAALAAARDAPPPRAEHDAPGAAPWVRAFAPILVERPRSAHAPRAARRRDAEASDAGAGWTVLAAPAPARPRAGTSGATALAIALRERLTDAPGGGTVVCAGASPDSAERDALVALLVAGAQDVAHRPRGALLAVVHEGAEEAAAFARALHLERPGATTCVLRVEPARPGAVDWVCDELRAAHGFVEAHRDAGGSRRSPALRHHALAPAPAGSLRNLLGPGDVLLVTGGGKGIAAECALDLARDTGARLLLVGRALPEHDAALAATLARARSAGVDAHYRAADVTDAAALRAAVAGARDALGPVTAVLHGAGVNEPCLGARLDAAAVARALGPKLDGAHNVLAAVEPERLRAWVSFGSVIARAGLAGEAHYALANAALAQFTERLQRQLPGCRCRCVEWSVWAGVGMGERLASVEALSRQGITPIHVDDGVAVLRRVLADDACPVCVVVAGRLGDAPTVEFDGPPLPLRRFLERPRVWYPGVELVADASLSPATDPYLDDHVVGGARVLPAVVALEAMAQAAESLAPGRRLTSVERLELLRPVVVPPTGGATVRLAALARDDGDVEVVVRASATDYVVDHVRALCRFGAASHDAARGPATREAADRGRPPGIDAAPLYATLLFQRGRFRRLTGYDVLHAGACRARLVPVDAASAPPWFGEYLPPVLLLGDPGARDACLHAVQACVPHRTLLPVAVERVTFAGPRNGAPADVRASEVARDGDLYTYDIEVRDADGAVCERWERASFRVVSGSAKPPRWPPALLGPYLERRTADLAPGAQLAAAVGEARGSAAADPATRASARADALRRLLGGDPDVPRRADGRPLAPDAASAVSVAHSGPLALAVHGVAPIGCDVERVVGRPADAWCGLLGGCGVALAAAMARDAGEPPAASATRVWAAAEALRKAGRPREPLALERADADGWAVLRAGDLTVLTTVEAVDGAEETLAVALALRGAAPAR